MKNTNFPQYTKEEKIAYYDLKITEIMEQLKTAGDPIAFAFFASRLAWFAKARRRVAFGY